MRRLSELQKGQSGIIRKFDEDITNNHLMEMGFLIGHEIKIDNIAPMGDPMAIAVAGYVLSLRKSEAYTIWVDICPQ